MDKATRGRGGGHGRRTTALVVPPTEDPESENGVSDVPSSGGVRSGDKATRGRGGGRGKRTTAFTVPARGETESENGAFLPPGHPECLPFHYFTPFFFHMHIPPPPPPHTHTHTHTQSHRQVVFILWTRQPEAEVEVMVGEPLLL